MIHIVTECQKNPEKNESGEALGIFKWGLEREWSETKIFPALSALF